MKRKVRKSKNSAVLLSLLVTVFLVGAFLLFTYIQGIYAATVTWDGGGDTGTCGAGNENDWSCAENWVGDAIPTSADIATFDGTSSKDCTIDSAVDVKGIDINTGYSGTITQAATITISTGGFDQAAGTFVGGSQAITIGESNFDLGASATFTSTSGTLSFERDLTINSGTTFAHGGGTISLIGTDGDDDATLACGSKTFNLVSINKSHNGANISIGSDCTLPLGTNPTTTAGVITNEGSIDVAGSGTWTINARIIQTSSSASIDLDDITTLDMNYLGGIDGYYTADFAITGGTYLANNLGTVYLTGDLDNSGGKFPSGVTLTLDGTSNANSILTCDGSENFATPVTINKTANSGTVTVNTNCVIPLGDNPTTSTVDLVIAGGQVVVTGSGTWTHNGQLSLTGGTLTATNIQYLDINIPPSWDGTLSLQSGTFTAPALNTVYIENSFNNTGDLFPKHGVTLTFDNGNTWGHTITCSGSENFTQVVFNSPSNYASVNIGASCIIPLDNSPTTIAGTITNNGTVNVGSGTWTISANYINAANSTTTLYGTTAIDANGDFSILSGSTFSENQAGDLTHLYLEGDLGNEAGLLPVGLTLTFDGDTYADDGTITCNGNENFATPVTINKNHYDAILTIGANCDLNLGTNPTVSAGAIINNGTLTASGSGGTGTWTLNSSLELNPGSSTTFTGDKILIREQADSSYEAHLTTAGGTLTVDNLTDLEIWGNFTNSGDIFSSSSNINLTFSDANSSNVTLDCGTDSFKSISVTKSSISSDVKFAGSCITSGDFIHTEGAIKNSNTPTILEVQGDFTASDQFDNSFGGANLTIQLTGENNQNLSQTDGSYRYFVNFRSPIEINKSSGAVSLASDFITIDGAATLDVIEGILDLNGYDLATGSTFTIENGGVLRVVGTEVFPEPVFNAGSTFEYKGDEDASGDTYALYDFTYKAFKVNMPDGADTVTPSETLTSDLEGYWRMEEGNGTTVDDSSVNNNVADLGGGAAFNSEVPSVNFIDNYSMAFDGGDWLDPGDNLDLAQNKEVVSVSAWIRKNSSSATDAVFNLSTGNSTSNLRFWLETYYDELRCGGNNTDASTSHYVTTNADVFSTDTWYHVACVADYANDKFSIYVDGVRQETKYSGSLTPGATPDTASQKSAIGIHTAKSSNPFDGYIDEVRFYDKALTGPEIYRLANGYDTNALSSVTIGEDFEVAGGIFTAPTNLTVTGDFIHSGGTFAHNSGAVVLDGTNQTLTGNTTFNNFTKDTTSTDTLTFAANSTQTFEGTMYLKGRSGNLLSLRSSSPATQWNIDPQSTRSIEYLDVQDSNNTNGTGIVTSGFNITDSGNNDGWNFSVPTYVISTAPEGTSLVLASNEGVDVTNTGQSGTVTVRAKKGVIPVVDAPVIFTQNRSWENVVVDTDVASRKAVVHFAGNSGHNTTHDIYIPKGGTPEVRICPSATVLNEVTSDCSGGVLFTGPFPQEDTVGGDTVTVSVVEYGGSTYWKASGLSGSGGQGEGSETEEFADGTWTRAGSVDTVIFTNTVDMDAGDFLIFTWNQGNDDVVDSPTVSDAEIDSTGVMAEVDQTRNVVKMTIPVGGMAAGSHTITGTFLKTYDSTTYSGHSLGINTTRSDNEAVGVGVAIKYDDNTVDVTASVPAFLNMSLNKTEINLGVLNVSSINSDTNIIAINTNDGLGYTLKITSNGHLTDGLSNYITPVEEDSEVTKGVEGYGIAVVAGNGAEKVGDFTDNDTPIPNSGGTGTPFITYDSTADNHSHSVTYRASISGATVGGVYTQVVTYFIATNI